MISNKVIFQRGFNELFFKFIDEIISMFSNDSDFLIARTTFETLKKANPSSIIKAWYNFITISFLNFSQQVKQESTEEKEKYDQIEVKYNVIIFLKNFELSDKNKISELNNFFIKLRREFDKMFNLSSLRSDKLRGDFDPVSVTPLNLSAVRSNKLRGAEDSEDVPEQNSMNGVTDVNKERLVVMESYFNQLNKLAISFHA
jgi:hypothetical protein